MAENHGSPLVAVRLLVRTGAAGARGHAHPRVRHPRTNRSRFSRARVTALRTSARTPLQHLAAALHQLGLPKKDAKIAYPYRVRLELKDEQPR